MISMLENFFEIASIVDVHQGGCIELRFHEILKENLKIKKSRGIQSKLL